MFESQTVFEHLNLYANQLTTLPETIFEHLSIHYLDLRGNSWKFDEKIEWFEKVCFNSNEIPVDVDVTIVFECDSNAQ